MLLLNVVPSYDDFKDVILYGTEQTITLHEVQSAIHAKELQRKLEKKSTPNGEGLSITSITKEQGAKEVQIEVKVWKRWKRTKSAKTSL